MVHFVHGDQHLISDVPLRRYDGGRRLCVDYRGLLGPRLSTSREG